VPRPGRDIDHPTGAPRARAGSARLRILVCEHDPRTRRALIALLGGVGFDVEATTTVLGACDRAALRGPDGAIVGAALPDGDGVDLCRRLREWSAMPLILVSADPDEDELVRGLEAGADHYLTTPVAPQELVARLRATLRRVSTRGDAAAHRLGDVEIDLAARTVRRAGEALHLTPTEFRLLRTLVLQRGRLLTHDALLEQVWGDGHGADTQILRTHMANLRRKIDPRDGARHIRTEHGVGYRLHGEPDGTPARVLRLVPADAGAAAPPIPRRRAA